MKSIFTVCCAAFCALSVGADEFHYNFSGSGDWSDSPRWTPFAGSSATVPGADDVIRIGSGEVLVAGGDLEVLKTLGEIELQQSDTLLIISNETEIVLDVHVSGKGKVIKEGTGKVTVPYAAEFALSNTGGWDVRRGDLVFRNPDNLDSVKLANPIAVNAPGRILLDFPCVIFRMYSLAGDGTIVNQTDGVVTNYFLNNKGAETQTFSGVFSGDFEYLGSDLSKQRFLGTGCSTLDRRVIMYQGHLGADRFPANGMVFRHNATFEYIGNGGEGAVGPVKNVNYNNSAQRLEFSAGQGGGCTLKYNFLNPKGKYTMNELVLSGDNALTAVFDGSFSMLSIQDGAQDLACYIKKTGTGTWRFTAADKDNRGTVAVEEGTLEYESIAHRGTSCSLGDATVLQSEYTGAFDAEKNVDYAYLLGDGTVTASGDDTVATMKYVGESDASVTGRTVAVKGSGRFSSASAALDWHGFTSAAAGSNELILGGDAVGCSASDVTDGPGKLSLVKEGSGDWLVDGDSSFSGSVEAKEGELKINSARNYGWYKLTLKENWRAETESGDGSIIWIAQFGLFDADGTNWIENLTHNKEANGNVGLLEPGEAALAHTDFYYHSNNEITYSLTNAFNSFNSCFGGKRSGCSFNPQNNPLNNPDAWVEIVVRPPEMAKPLVRYDIRQWGCMQVNYQRFARDVRSWTLEGSMDGVNWENLDTVISNANPATGAEYKWISTNDTGAHDAGEGLGPIEAGPGSAVRLAAVESVSAAVGATVKVNAPVTTAKIRCDYAGGGTIEGFALAENGVIEMVNVPDDAARPLRIPVSLVDVSGIGNLSGYTVKVNGTDMSWKARYSNGYLRQITGTVLLIR